VPTSTSQRFEVGPSSRIGLRALLGSANCSLYVPLELEQVELKLPDVLEALETPADEDSNETLKAPQVWVRR